MTNSSYRGAGVDIDAANQLKRDFSALLERKNVTLNRKNAFAAIIDADLKRYADPVLVFKSEEPGSKQLIAFDRDSVESVCTDMVNHLVNDCIVCGATPVAIQDVIVCGKLDPAIARRAVAAMSAASVAQDCFLSGGETSEQPGVLPEGRYILSSSIIGVAERAKIVDGSAVAAGDIAVAIASSGLHTNGFSLVRRLMAENPELPRTLIDGRAFADILLDVHACYYRALRPLFERSVIKGAAHITGGGIRENLNRILPEGIDAAIDLARYRPQPIFDHIRRAGGIADDEMLRTFNLGVGMVVIVAPEHVDTAIATIGGNGFDAWIIGEAVRGHGNVVCSGAIPWTAQHGTT